MKGRVKKIKNWWKKPFAAVLSATLLASSFTMAGMPEEVKAAEAAPGGVTKKPQLWLRADNGVTADGGTVSEWKDQSGNVNFEQTESARQPAFDSESDRLNFNQTVTFDGVNDYLKNMDGVLGTGNISDLEIFVVVNMKVYTTGSVFWERTNNAAGGTGPRINVHPLETWDAGNHTVNRVISADNPSGKYFIMNYSYAYTSAVENSLTIRRNGKEVNYKGGTPGTLAGRVQLVGNSQPLYIGSGYGTTVDYIPAGYLNGAISEFLVFKEKLTEEDIQKIESYLAIKYGQTLDKNYLNSNGEIVWAYDNEYYSNVAGIGHDAASGLEQKQSRATEDASKLTIGVGTTLSSKNEEVTSMLIDGQYLIWGDNGKALTFNTQIGTTNKNHADRIWKVQNTGNVGEVLVVIPKQALPENLTLFVGSSETDFTAPTASEYPLTEVTFEGETYLQTRATLGDGQYFTFAAPAPVPTSATIEKTVTEENKVTLTFDEEIALTSLTKSTGFTITVGGSPIDLQEADFAVDPLDAKKLIITLPDGTNVTDKEVKVAYEGTGNLKGTNGVPVGSFEKVAEDLFVAAFTITSPSTDPVTTSKPNISGTVETGSTVAVVIKDKDDNPVTDAGGNATVDGAGNWTFTPSVDLENGDYTIEVTATKDSITTTKTKDMSVAVTPTLTPTVALTAPMENTVTTSKPTFAGTATPGATIKVKIAEGNELTTTADESGNWSVTPEADLADDTYTVEITAEKDGKTSEPFQKQITIDTKPSVNKTNLQKIVDEINGEQSSGTLDEEDYTPASWQWLLEKLTEANQVLTNPTATQQQVDDALSALEIAKSQLVPITTDFAVTITEPSSQVTTSMPVFKGTVTTGATIEIVIKNEQGTSVIGAGGSASVDDVGNWSFKPPTGLTNGTYTAEVTATKDDKTATTTTTFTVNTLLPVDKTALQAKVTEIINEGIKVDEYTADSWNTLQTAIESSEAVLNDEQATQAEVDLALSSLGAARNALVKENQNGGENPTPSEPITEIIEVDVVIGGDNEADITKVPVRRTTYPDGNIKDHVTFTEDKAEEAVLKAVATGVNIARVVIPDAEDEVDEVKVDIPSETVSELQENGIDLEIFTENATIQIPNSSLTGLDDDFYFRLVPVKKENDRKEIEERARVEQVVRVVAGNSQVGVVARPMTIETNLSSRPVTLTLPLKDVNLPTNVTERATFLANLGIFIEHSDGEKEVVRGKVVTIKDGTLGLQFTVNKFSTFTIIDFTKRVIGGGTSSGGSGGGSNNGTKKPSTKTDEANHEKKLDEEAYHEAYIKGFPDGTFKPNEAVTRAQLAAMIARNLGYEKRTQIASVPFGDVVTEHYAYNPISFVYEFGIMSGDDKGNFRPNDSITRAEMATVIANYKQIKPQQNTTKSFNDITGHWAQWTIEAVHNEGLINGYEDGAFRPEWKLTRAEAAVLVNRLFDRGPLYGINRSSFSDVSTSHWAFCHIEEAAKDHLYQIDENNQEQFLK